MTELIVECAFKLTPQGAVFRLDDDPPEDEMCELRVTFDFSGLWRDYDGVAWRHIIHRIELRAIGEPWRPLPSLTREWFAACAFLDEHCRKDLDEAENEAALAQYYGD